ncbi:MAG: putative C-S lyase [Candidatus Mcinerneyibacterium aminivorans]|uniref:cysteine-S-conjugate beta-lyase n=1 Tax=Candidatus Mcinerneyibacterium aminivorans TaxID=2703815 RepID=A0A5D0MFM8_9BACT|nr:MAG: putative C-S lyase [Candidatus Mcinerneyibacterium aminivorans]
MNTEYNFDEIVNRTNTNSIKWDYYKKFMNIKKDLLPMWVADMDFKAPPEVIKALEQRASHGIYGYSGKPESYYDSIISWVDKRYNWKIKKEWIVYTPGIVPAINMAIDKFTEPGDGIVVQKPVYFPFFQSVNNQDRRVVDNKLVIENGKYVMDFNDLENKVNENTKMILLCSPHNPVGRVWKEEELKKLGDIAKKYDLMVFSDEIHADLILNDNQHISFASLSDDLAKRTITGFSPSKTFNIAGLYASAIVIPDESIRDKFKEIINRYHLYHTNCFAIEGLEAAYRYGEKWLDELLDYLEKNIELTKKVLKDIKKLNMIEPEGTFLVWLDFRKFNLTHEEITNIIINEAGLLLNDGKMFGANGEKFMRLNIATPQKKLKKGLEKLKNAFANKD